MRWKRCKQWLSTAWQAWEEHHTNSSITDNDTVVVLLSTRFIDRLTAANLMPGGTQLDPSAVQIAKRKVKVWLVATFFGNGSEGVPSHSPLAKRMFPPVTISIRRYLYTV
jgi:hypothetical protein